MQSLISRTLSFLSIAMLALSASCTTDSPGPGTSGETRGPSITTQAEVIDSALPLPEDYTIAPLVRTSELGSPHWDRYIAPVIERDSPGMVRATSKRRLDFIQMAVCRALRVSEISPAVSVETWAAFCHYWPVYPLTSVRAERVRSLAELEGDSEGLPPIWIGPSPEISDTWEIATMEPTLQGAFELKRKPISCIGDTEYGGYIDSLSPGSLMLEGRSEEFQQGRLRVYAMSGRDAEDAYFGELMWQTQKLVLRAVWHRHDLVSSLESAIQNNAQMLQHGSLTKGEAEPAELKVYFDGVQSYRFVLVYPDGLVEDSVRVIEKIAVDDGVSSVLMSRLRWETLAGRPWTFIGGVKLPPFGDVLTSSLANVSAAPAAGIQ